MSSEGNIFPSASGSNFAKAAHRSLCVDVKVGREGTCGVQRLWGREGAGWATLDGNGDDVGQEAVKASLMLMSCTGRAAWLCVSEVTAALQGQVNHK